MKTLVSLLVLMLLNFSNLWSQATITGTVQAKKEGPVPGINIIEKGTTNGTLSKTDGSFIIEVSDSNATLLFTLVGMVTQEIPIIGL